MLPTLTPVLMWHSIICSGMSLAASVLSEIGFVVEASHEIEAKLVAVGLKCYRSSSVPNNLFSWIVLSLKFDWTEIFFVLRFLKRPFEHLRRRCCICMPQHERIYIFDWQILLSLTSLPSLPHPIFPLPRAGTCWFRLQPGSGQSRLLFLPGFLVCWSPQAEMDNLPSSCV